MPLCETVWIWRRGRRGGIVTKKKDARWASFLVYAGKKNKNMIEL